MVKNYDGCDGVGGLSGLRPTHRRMHRHSSKKYASQKRGDPDVQGGRKSVGARTVGARTEVLKY